MENNGDKTELLGLYKPHVELADRVNQQREAANRLFVSTLTGVSVLLSDLLRFGTDDIPIQAIIISGSFEPFFLLLYI